MKYRSVVFFSTFFIFFFLEVTASIFRTILYQISSLFGYDMFKFWYLMWHGILLHIWKKNFVRDFIFRFHAFVNRVLSELRTWFFKKFLQDRAILLYVHFGLCWKRRHSFLRLLKGIFRGLNLQIFKNSLLKKLYMIASHCFGIKV